VGLARFICAHRGQPTVRTKKCSPCSKLGRNDQRRYEGLLFHDLRRECATWCAQGYPNASPWTSPVIKPGRYLIVTIS
jgi:hypothetical protein